LTLSRRRTEYFGREFKSSPVEGSSAEMALFIGLSDIDPAMGLELHVCAGHHIPG
jgi:hypothetical protein